MLLTEKLKPEFLDLLKKEFSEIDFLEDVLVTKELATKLFRFLNTNCFRSELKEIPIYVVEAMKLLFPDRGVIQYGGFFYRISDDSLFEYEKQKFKNSNALTIEMFFKFSNLRDQHVNFYGFLSIMAHEMVHMYATLYGPGKVNQALRQLYAKHGLDYDEWYDAHNNSAFNLEVSRLKKDYGIVITEKFEKDAVLSMIENVVRNGKSLIIDDSKNVSDVAVDLAKKLRKWIVDDGQNAIYVDDTGITVGFFD